MVTPALKKLFAEEGVGVIPLYEGSEQLVDELCIPPGEPCEVVIGGLLPGQRPAAGKGLANSPDGPKLEVSFERKLDVDSYEFLRSHVMNSEPVLPVAMIMEWLAHGALHSNPGFVFHGFDDLRILKGVTLVTTAPYPIRVLASRAGKGATPTVNVELRGGERTDERVHARARVILASSLPKADDKKLTPATGDYPRGVEDIYKEVLFHGSHFRAIKKVEACSEDGIVAEVTSAPSPANWMSEPLRSSWLSDPLVMDAAFQLMILWTEFNHGEVSLPNYLAGYRQYAAIPAEGLKTVIKARKKSSSSATADIEFLDAQGNLVARIEGYECTMSPSLRSAFERRTLDA